jgi:oxygen-independent coproporphyrinogen III oxidase
MWPYHPDLFETPVPRYTSYPTALEFSDQVGEADMLTALEAVDTRTGISLYVHIPYCKEICWYCGCNTGAANREHRLQTYLEALEMEIAHVARVLGGRGKVRRVAFGGGSPNAIPPIAFVRLVDRLATQFSGGKLDISVELDPRALTQDWIRVLALAGVTRVSFGVQSFSESIQSRIGRIQPVAMIEQAVKDLRQHGTTSINFDLMYGLPGQSLAVLEETLDHVIRMRPERIALFGYAHVPTMFPRQKRIAVDGLPGLEERFQQAARGFERLVAAGYVAVGFDHFALPDDPLAKAAGAGMVHRNFQGFSEDDCDVLIGFGASAISSFPHLHVQNERAAGPYRDRVAAGELPVWRGVRRSADDRSRGQLIEQMLANGRCDLPPDLADAPMRERLDRFCSLGLVEMKGQHIALAPDGLPYARAIAASFDAYRSSAARNHAPAI